MKVYVVKAPFGEYEGYREPIDKIFIDEIKAVQYVLNENSKLPLKQAEQCEKCFFKWDNPGQRGKEKPNCYNGDKYNMCQEYNKYRDISKLFIEEQQIEGLEDFIKQIKIETGKQITKLMENKTGVMFGMYNQQTGKHNEVKVFELSDLQDIIKQIAED